MIIDLRQHPEAQHGEKLVRAFDHLFEGGHLVLLTDREPGPERQTLEQERPGQYTWNPRQQGPDVWQVWLGKIDRDSIHP